MALFSEGRSKMLRTKLRAARVARVSVPIIPFDFKGKYKIKIMLLLFPKHTWLLILKGTWGFKKPLEKKKKTIRIQTGETENSSPTAISDVYRSSPLCPHANTCSLKLLSAT